MPLSTNINNDYCLVTSNKYSKCHNLKNKNGWQNNNLLLIWKISLLTIFIVEFRLINAQLNITFETAPQNNNNNNNSNFGLGFWAPNWRDAVVDSSTNNNNSYNNNNNFNTNNFSTTNNKTTQVLYKVLRVVPENGQQLAFLDRLEKNDGDLKLNFWTSPIRVGSIVDIMIPFENLHRLKRIFERNELQINVIIEDVESLIIQRERKHKDNNDFGRRFRDDIDNAFEYNFHQYGSYPQMIVWMRALARKYSSFVKFISIGKSHEGRSIDGLEIGSRGLRKRAFWIDGGIHAREWAAPHTALFFIHQLTSKYSRDPNITRMINEITWIIVPLLNPDGYEFTRSSTNPNVRLWRKNRAPTHCIRDQWGRDRCCKGVDLNRNFDFHFKESGSSDDPCSEIYQGKAAFSEPEAKAVRDAILSTRYRGRIDGFITMHTYSQIWIHPYGHKRDSYPGDVQDLYNVGKKATLALGKLYGTKYLLGSGADTLYPASGGSEDWAKESAAIKFVYLLELRPDEKNWDGFILEENQLIPTVTETWAGVKVVAEAIIQRAKNRVTQHRISGIKQYRFGDGTPGSCYDIRHACKRWIQESETLCKTVPVFMREQCAYSCGFC